jgi:cobyrinic acid a,c-diamide synthase
VPVLGALQKLPQVRSRLATLPPGTRPPADICRRLGESLMRFWRLDRLWEIASRREVSEMSVQPMSPEPRISQLRVAVAYDGAFNCYFPDALDCLEGRGASVTDFSPIHDEGLPSDTDLVYLGCGHPERFADALENNHCMKAALRIHLLRGGRIYAEGGGLAYLCQQMELPSGQCHGMVGIVPSIARLRRRRKAPTPVEVVFPHRSWLGSKGARLRGYCSTDWYLEPVGCSGGRRLARPQYIVGCRQVVGSLVHLNFAAHPEFLRRFFHPLCVPARAVDPWAAAL